MGFFQLKGAFFSDFFLGIGPLWRPLACVVQLFDSGLMFLSVPKSFIRQSKDGCTISLKVVPRSSKNQIVGVENGALKIKLTAPPVEGSANEAVVEFLADFLKKPKRFVTLISGQQSRNKVVLVSGVKVKEILDTLNQ